MSMLAPSLLAVAGVAAVVSVLAGALGVLAVRYVRLARRVAAQEQAIAALGRDLTELLRCEQGVSARLRDSEQRLSDIARAQRRLASADRDTLSVDHVKKLLARGSTVEEIVGTSELSTTELELLAAINARERSGGHRPVPA